MFPVADYWWFYLGFTALILVLLAVDLGVFHRKSHTISIREAARWSVVWISLALLFNVAFYYYATITLANDPRLLAQPGFDAAAAARRVGLEFLAGYVVEYTLSVDNIFVFVMVFSYFAIPPKYQHRVLFYGILGALIFRAIFIALGSYLMAFHAVVIVFGAFLILTGLKMMFVPDKGIDPEKNPVIKLMRRLMPITPELDGSHFVVRRDARWYGTPLLVALVFIEVSDIIFAVDSVPAIFAISREPLVVFTSNVFAILGLRAMYFLLAGIVDRFVYLKYGLALVLVFVGLKMVWLNEAFGGKFPISWSLGIIGSVIGLSVAASLLLGKKEASPGKS